MLSVTLVICIKTVQARITESSLWAAPRTLDIISCPWVRGSPRTRASKIEDTALKRRYFALISSYSVKTVADSYRHAAYHNKHWFINIDDRKRPWTRAV